MKQEQVNQERMKEMEVQMGCRFCEDGEFAEMSLTLEKYEEKTEPIASVTFGFYHGDVQELKKAVALVDEDWVQYFDEESPVFCAYLGNRIASFCLVEEDSGCMLAVPGSRVGSIGCVGTVPEFRCRGIGLRMVDLATVHLKKEGFDKVYIHYTHVDHLYAKLGYETIARFSFL